MKALIERMREFETTDESIESFNKIFSDCRLSGFSDDAIVTIGEPCTPETVRMIEIEGTEFRHDFMPVQGESLCN